MHTTPLEPADFDACPCCRASFQGARKPEGHRCYQCRQPLPGVPAPKVEVYRFARAA